MSDARALTGGPVPDADLDDSRTPDFGASDCPVTGSVPAKSTAVSSGEAAVVIGGVQRRMPSTVVGFHDADFGAGFATDAVCITVVVATLRRIFIPAHRCEVHCHVAATAGSSQINSVTHFLAEQLHSQVMRVIVAARIASVCEVDSAALVRGDPVALWQHFNLRSISGLPAKRYE